MVDSNVAKGEIVTVKKFSEITNFTGLIPGAKYYTRAGSIVIDSTNNKLDFKEGAGAELNATVSSGTYYRGVLSDVVPYSGLCAAIKTALEALGGGTYTVTYSILTQLFTISSTVAFTLLFGTGTNIATDIAETIGFDASDTSSATSQVSDNEVKRAGEIVRDVDTGVVVESVYVGYAVAGDGTTLFTEQNYSISDYSAVMQHPGDWLATPEEKDYSAGSNGIQHHDTHMSSNGYGLILLMDNTNNAVQRIRFKNPNGVWQDSTTTISHHTPGTGGVADNFSVGSYFFRGYCRVDDNGHGFLAICRYNTTNAKYGVWEYHSTDLDTWTGSELEGDASYNYHVGNVAMREDKAVILMHRSDAAVSGIFISDRHSTNGYNTWSSRVDSTIDYYHSGVSSLNIQFFSEQVGANKYRIVCVSNDPSRIQYEAWKGDGTFISTAVISTSVAGTQFGTGIDQLGLKNRLVFVYVINSTNVTNVRYSNEDYNSNVITWSSPVDINPSAYTWDKSNGYISESETFLIWNVNKRIIVLDKKVYITHSDNRDSGWMHNYLHWTKDITSGTWETPIRVSETLALALQDKEYCGVYIPATNTIMAGYKQHDTATAGSLTEGQIYVRPIALELDGTPIMGEEAEQIDGGEAQNNLFNGYFTLAASADSAIAVWEHDITTNNVLRWNNFK